MSASNSAITSLTGQKTKVSWEKWENVNLDEFRQNFPELRHVENAAITLILSQEYKQTLPSHTPATLEEYKYRQTHLLLNTTTLLERIERWRQEFEKHFEYVSQLKNQTLTPTNGAIRSRVKK